MAIEKIDGQQTSCNAMAVIDGVRRQVASAVCAIRPDRGMNISIEVMPELAKLTQQDFLEITAMYSDYIAGEIVKAANLGIPVALPGQ